MSDTSRRRVRVDPENENAGFESHVGKDLDFRERI